MNDATFVSRLQRVAMVSRRGSLRVLGGAALAGAIAAPAATEAGKSGTKARKLCQRQKSGCEEVVRAQCGDNATCVNATLPCCALLAECKGREATECFLSG
jgi:hypothetical protein